MVAATEKTFEERVAEATADLFDLDRRLADDWEPICIPMSYDEFLNFELPDVFFEWADGEAVEVPVGDRLHVMLQTWLMTLLYMWVERQKLGEVLAEDYSMRAEEDGNARKPDVRFVAAEHLKRIGEKGMTGPCDVAVEVISPSTAKLDRVTKFREYASGGVGEYWLLDPRKKQAQFFRLVDGRYEPATFDRDGNFRSSVIDGVFIDPDWLWDQPPVDDILARWQAEADKEA